jgi:sugar phosphate isomerase/epimerase
LLDKERHGVAQSGNGIDIGAVYQLLSEVAQTVRSHDEQFARLNGRLDGVEGRLEDLDASVADLRSAVRDYHTTVTGHGMLYGELEQRIRRIERHLKLEPTGK